MNRLSVHSRQHTSGFSCIATIWFLVFVALGGAFVCSSYLGRNDRSANERDIAEAGRPVSLSSGPISPHTKHIEDVKAGDRVWAYDTSTRTWTAKTVLKPLVHDYQGDLITVTVEGRSVVSTGNHPYWVASGNKLQGRREAQDVSEVDRHRLGAVGKWVAGDLISISVGDRTIQCTGNHPFWVVSGKALFDRPQAQDVYPEDRTSAIALGNGRWIEARRLEAGDSLMLRDGSLAPIDEVQITATHQKVYNLQVADLHTYGVTDLGVAVHNKPCFPPGTMVLMGDGTTKPIEDVQLGDEVLACDPLSSEPPAQRSVTGLIRDCTTYLVHVSIAGAQRGGGTLTATRYHPFWTSNRGWVDAQELTPDDVLRDEQAHPLYVTSVVIEHRLARTYNLTVANSHTYFALTTNHRPVLVHNQDSPPIPPYVYRSGGSNPGNLTPRAVDNGHLSTWDNVSDPVGGPPNFNPTKPIQVIDTSRLPPGSVQPDGIPYGPEPPGHVSIGPNVPPETVKNAIVKTLKPPS